MLYLYILRLRTQCHLQQQRQSLQHWDGRYFQSKEMETVFSVPLAFHGSEMMHCKTQMLLSHFVATNHDRFKGIVLDDDVENHGWKMQHLTVWGTIVELQAAASLYQVPVYLLNFPNNYISSVGSVTNLGIHQR